MILKQKLKIFLINLNKYEFCEALEQQKPLLNLKYIDSYVDCDEDKSTELKEWIKTFLMSLDKVKY